MNRFEPTEFALDNALHRLNLGSTVEQRLDILRQLAEDWRGSLRNGDGFTKEELKGIPIPIPLRRWYQAAGRRTSILSGQNHLLGPEKLKLDHDGRVLFYVENQGVYVWSTMLQGDDPPVWGRFNEADIPWTEEGMTLSEFLIGACLFQAIMDAPFGAAAAWAEQEMLDKIASSISPLPLVSWRWPVFPSRFYGRNGAFMFACPYDGNPDNKAFSIWVGAKTAPPLAFLKELVDEGWEYAALE